MKRMTLEKTPESQKTALKSAVLLKRFQRIHRAGREKSAPGRGGGRQMFSIKTYNADQHTFHFVSPSIWSTFKSPSFLNKNRTEVSSSHHLAYRLFDLATITMLYPERNEFSFKRYISFKRRRMRFLCTAPPSLVLTVIPSRFSVELFLAQYTTAHDEAALLPLLYSLLNS